MLVRDQEIFSEFGEVVEFQSAQHRDDVELFRAQIVRKVFSPHVHDGYVIGVVERGVERFHWRGAERYATSTDLVFINPDQVHTGEAAERSGVIYRNIFVATDAMKQIVGCTVYFPDPVVSDPVLGQRLKLALDTLAMATEPLAYDSIMEALIFDIAARHGRGFQDNTPDLMHGFPGMSRMIEYIDANIGNTLRVEELADIANLSRFHFIRRFRKMTGVTPIAFVQARRTSMAKTLLRKGGNPSSIALITGFADQSHLTRWLKACYGVTPRVYKGKR
ncbi:AraC family transcriptional regulator [Massilia scottii]|uniref:AraC family transcriptional regulator n=1 Tax=Massilia scottii TaxID=3057166 RepID=UPI002796BBA7|nr:MULTISPECIES: AraC family transcriptional regulator [unclassified Massilia]MDQ1814535.1 AraC family transcriptional regulator [Massilia sp. CCM 9210]MDQ1833126.1 AraC family transcriptional regulator [Massilia sp. CCM 9029]